jgi:hypothetical protein
LSFETDKLESGKIKRISTILQDNVCLILPFPEFCVSDFSVDQPNGKFIRPREHVLSEANWRARARLLGPMDVRLLLQ